MLDGRSHRIEPARHGPPPPARPPALLVAALGVTQAIAWASSYYLPAILARPMAQAAGLPVEAVFLAVSGALGLAGLCGPAVGRAIDRRGGRGILAASNLLFAAGLCGLAAASGPGMLALGWGLMGLGMAAGLYEAAFAVLARLAGARRAGRSPASPSSPGWPARSAGRQQQRWRPPSAGAALASAGRGCIWPFACPCICCCCRAARHRPRQPRPRRTGRAPSGMRAPWRFLAFAFAALWFSAGAMAMHLPALLVAVGASPAAALAAAALVGPARVRRGCWNTR